MYGLCVLQRNRAFFLRSLNVLRQLVGTGWLGLGQGHRVTRPQAAPPAMPTASPAVAAAPTPAAPAGSASRTSLFVASAERAEAVLDAGVCAACRGRVVGRLVTNKVALRSGWSSKRLVPL